MQTQQSYQFGGNNNNPFKGLIGIAMAIFFFIALFWFMNFLFALLWKVLPLIIIATAIIDHKVILGYVSWVGRMFRNNWLAGLLIAALTIVGAPVVSLFLLGKALLKKKVKTLKNEAERQRDDEFVTYEEVESEVLELPEIEVPRPKKDNNGEYDQMFK